MSMPNQTAAGPTPSQGTEIVVADSVDELLAGASQREPMVAGAGKSGAAGAGCHSWRVLRGEAARSHGRLDDARRG